VNRAPGGRRRQGRPSGGSAPIVRAVLAAAIKQLGERGLDGLNIEEIAKSVGLNKTSVYRRWRSKRDLVLAALLARREEEAPFVETGDVAADLVRVIRAKVARLSTPQGRKISQVLMAFNDPDAMVITRGLRQNRYSVPSAIIGHAIARGELPRGLDPVLLSELLLAPVLYRRIIWNEPVTDSYIRRVVRHLLPAARPAGRPKRGGVKTG
jgi:AcrR family transcriptional regulator